MRRILATLAVTAAMGATVALTGLSTGAAVVGAQPVPTPVGVSNGNGVCVSAFSWVPQCTGSLS